MALLYDDCTCLMLHFSYLADSLIRWMLSDETLAHALKMQSSRVDVGIPPWALPKLIDMCNSLGFSKKMVWYRENKTTSWLCEDHIKQLIYNMAKILPHIIHRTLNSSTQIYPNHPKATLAIGKKTAPRLRVLCTRSSQRPGWFCFFRGRCSWWNIWKFP